MFDIVCVTDFKSCVGDFFQRIDALARGGIDAVILREKDLNDDEYFILAQKVLGICSHYNTRCILHGHIKAARKLNAKAIHLPLVAARTLCDDDRAFFETIGVSCHSVGEAKEAQSMGASYVTFGHVFESCCKPELPPRGLKELAEVVGAVSLPVWAIGGINEQNIAKTLHEGASGACLRSQLMRCENIREYISLLKKAISRK